MDYLKNVNTPIGQHLKKLSIKQALELRKKMNYCIEFLIQAW